MSTPTAPAIPLLDEAAPFRHEAFVYRGEAEFLAGAVPFVRDAWARGEPVLVAVDTSKIARLREHLGPGGEPATFVPMEEVGRNPGRIISVWHDFLDRHPGRPVRGIGEPVWAGRAADELVECQQHEHLLNVAFGHTPGFWLRCPYDGDALDEAVLTEAAHSHPILSDITHSGESAGFVCPDDLLARPIGMDPRRDDRRTTEWTLETPADLSPVRAELRAGALRAGLAPERAADLLLAVGELTANSLRYAGGGTVRSWSDGRRVVVEVQDRGTIGDPLVGRRRPGVDEPTGRGLWLVHQVGDLVQVRSSSAGTIVRVSFDLDASA